MENMSASTNGKKLNRIKKAENAIVQFIKFSFVGVLNTLLSEGGYTVLIYFNMHYLPASFISFSLSVVNAYFWNVFFVFREQTKDGHVWWKTFIKTYLAYTWGYVLHALLLVFWIDIIDIAQWMGPLSEKCISWGLDGCDPEFLGSALAAFLNLLVTGPVNFVVNKYWAFRGKGKGKK